MSEPVPPPRWHREAPGHKTQKTQRQTMLMRRGGDREERPLEVLVAGAGLLG